MTDRDDRRTAFATQLAERWRHDLVVRREDMLEQMRRHVAHLQDAVSCAGDDLNKYLILSPVLAQATEELEDLTAWVEKRRVAPQ